MIGTLNVKISAHNPSFPLEPVFTFVNSAQSFRLLNVPRKIGKWDITKVFVNLNYPDNTTIKKECVLNGNIWIGTVEGCAESGTSTNGFIVTASGIDEDGNAVSNYVLGAGDLYVKDLDGTIDPERVGTKMYFNDTLPSNPKKGDATFIDGVLNVYDGANWVPVAESPDPSFIIDADGNKICADRTSTWRTKSSWFISSLGDGEITFDPPLECAWEQISYRDSGEGALFHKWMWISKSPYAYGLYIGIDPDLTYVEYYYKDGDIYEVGSGDVISSHAENSITAINDIPCSITRNSEWSEQTGKLALESQLPTKTSDLTNDSDYITSTQVEPYQYIAGYASKANTSLTVASRNTYNNGLEFPVKLNTSEEGTSARVKLTRHYMNDWNLTQYDQTSYATPVLLKWQPMTIKKVLFGTVEATVYQGYGWMSEPDENGKQYAIGCANVYGEATPNNFYYNDGTGNKFNVTKTLTLSANGLSIASVEGGTAIACTRISEQWRDSNVTVANLDDLPTKTSDITNDSGFITTDEVLPYHNPMTPTVNTGLADKAYSLALIDPSGKILDGYYIGTHTFTRDLKDEFTFGASFITYWPYFMYMFNGQTYDPPLELKLCLDTLTFIRAGRPKIIYNGWMFRTSGAGVAIPCSEDGTPAGTLYETTAVEANRILVVSDTPHTIGFTVGGSDPYGQIISLDGEPNITANRQTNAKTNNVNTEVANKSDLPTKTSDLTNDSGFATETYVDNIVGDINSALDAINGEVI